MIPDPSTAPPRPDLTFLRHRARARTRPANPALGDFLTGRATRPRATPAPAAAPAHAPAPAPTPAPLDLSRPAAPARRPPTPAPAPAAPAVPASSSSLDLSAPTTPTPEPPAPPAAPSPSPGPPPISFARPGRDVLDLTGATDAPANAAPAPARVAPAPRYRLHRDARITGAQHQLLSITDPTVTLSRVQSGIGQLEIEAVCSPDLGDLRLGAAYQLRGGRSSTVQYTGGNRFAPSSRRPVLVAGRDEYEHLRVDLRQVSDLERLAVYAFSESRAELTWGGTLVVTTFGGARIELPLESLHAGRVAVLLSIYNLDGELVVRAEMETIAGDVRDAARAYGYDRITWRDDRNPVE